MPDLEKLKLLKTLFEVNKRLRFHNARLSVALFRARFSAAAFKARLTVPRSAGRLSSLAQVTASKVSSWARVAASKVFTRTVGTFGLVILGGVQSTVLILGLWQTVTEARAADRSSLIAELYGESRQDGMNHPGTARIKMEAVRALLSLERRTGNRKPNLMDLNLSGLDLGPIDFTCAKLNDSDFSGTRLSSGTLLGKAQSLIDVNFSGAQGSLDAEKRVFSDVRCDYATDLELCEGSGTGRSCRKLDVKACVERNYLHSFRILELGSVAPRDRDELKRRSPWPHQCGKKDDAAERPAALAVPTAGDSSEDSSLAGGLTSDDCPIPDSFKEAFLGEELELDPRVARAIYRNSGLKEHQRWTLPDSACRVPILTSVELKVRGVLRSLGL